MENQFLALLACPRCHGSFEAVAALSPAGGEGLVCRACCLFFPVNDGIPVLLLDEAKAWPGANTPEVAKAPESTGAAPTGEGQ